MILAMAVVVTGCKNTLSQINRTRSAADGDDDDGRHFLEEKNSHKKNKSSTTYYQNVLLWLSSDSMWRHDERQYYA